MNEPTIEETIQILKGLKEKYEDFHEVTYSDEALEAASPFHRYIQDRFLPDKIDLMDEPVQIKLAIRSQFTRPNRTAERNRREKKGFSKKKI